MRAIVCRELGPAENLVQEEDWPQPEPGPEDVVIKVQAAALNFPDTLTIQGKYQFKPELPFVPGGECAGIVEAVGSNVTDFAPGDKVVAMGSGGTLLEKMVTPQATVLPMPQGVDFREAAGISVSYFTSYYALKQRANLQAGETLLVLGAAGGVGITAVELGKAMGATVIAAASSEEKLQLAREMGADHLINYSETSLKEAVKELTGGKGVDVVYDPVGGDFSEAALRCMAWKGRFLVVGFASGPIPKVPLNLVLLKGCQVVGVFWGVFSANESEENRKNIDELWAMFASGQLKPAVSDVYPLKEYVAAFSCLTERRARGKVILEIAVD